MSVLLEMESFDHVLVQVIVLDTDITFTTDIVQLWRLLSVMKEKHKVSFTIHR